MADRYMKRCSASLINREMQTKTTVRYHVAPVRTVFIKKMTSVHRGVEKKEPLLTVGANVNWCSRYGKPYAAAAAAKSLLSCPTVWPHRRQPTRLPRPWDSPGKNTGVGCHFLLQCMKVKSESEVAQLCPTLRDPMYCSLEVSSKD